jgi:hypothetical protein
VTGREETWYRLHVRSRRQVWSRRRRMLWALARAALILGSATFVAAFLWSFNVLGRTL